MSPLLTTRPAFGRRPSHAPSSALMQVVPGIRHGVVPPPKGSHIRLHGVAYRSLQWWPHERQRALYADLVAGTLPLEPLINGREACRIEREFLMVSRAGPRLTIEAIFDDWPGWRD